jgi:hypothetical protein
MSGGRLGDDKHPRLGEGSPAGLVSGKPTYAELEGHYRAACRMLAEQRERIAELEHDVERKLKNEADAVELVARREVDAWLRTRDATLEIYAERPVITFRERGSTYIYSSAAAGYPALAAKLREVGQ